MAVASIAMNTPHYYPANQCCSRSRSYRTCSLTSCPAYNMPPPRLPISLNDIALLVSLLLTVLLVRASVHQVVELTVIFHLNLDKPGIGFGVRVDHTGLITEDFIDLRDGSGNGSINIRRGLDGFDRAEGITLLEFIPDLGQVHENDVTKGGLSKVSDANGGNLSINLAIFVRWGEISAHHSGSLSAQGGGGGGPATGSLDGRPEGRSEH
mmetsp:Transcript_3119/g.5327  ORF Transcript_3119/g.5327 Transcript_3119/m.5327 type:complete len:210 (+) Transcript_3119:964-1593(+)